VIPSQFDYFRPATLQEALVLLTKYQDDAKVLAGGQSLLSLMKLRLANPKCVVDIGQIEGLSYIREEEGAIAIGAMTTYNQIRDSKLLQSQAPLLPKAAAVVGDVQVRNRGTLGGCVAHADPAGDVPAALLATGADLRILGPGGERWVKITEFFLGLYATALAPDEILTEVRVPILKGWKFAYLKAARRPSDFAIVGVAAALRTEPDGVCEEIGIAVTGVTDKPYRADAVEAKLKGARLDGAAIAAAAPLMTEGVDVSANIHASAEFRAHLAQVYLRRVIEAAV
jgi:carbon-monoxide dehydrogenase medium subunit